MTYLYNYHYLHLLVIFLGIIIFANSKFLDSSGKFLVNINYVKICDKNNENAYNLNISARKYNRTHIGINAHAFLSEPFDEKHQLEIELRIWGDGGWKNNFFHLKRNNACLTLYMLFGPIWEKILLTAGCMKGCPVKPGNYSIHDYNIDLSKCKIVIQTGRFYVILKIIKNNKVYECVEGEVEVV